MEGITVLKIASLCWFLVEGNGYFPHRYVINVSKKFILVSEYFASNFIVLWTVFVYCINTCRF